MSDPLAITGILRSLSAGEAAAADRLFPLVYDELRRLARGHMLREKPGHTLQATELVHEVYLKVVDQSRVQWQDRSHFMAVAAQAMRRILIDHARRRGASKRGGKVEMLPLTEALVISAKPQNIDLLALDQSLTRLQAEQADKATVVEMRFFGGLSEQEIAEVMGVSTRTVIRHWKYAQAWLYRDLRDAAEKGPAQR